MDAIVGDAQAEAYGFETGRNRTRRCDGPHAPGTSKALGQKMGGRADAGDTPTVLPGILPVVASKRLLLSRLLCVVAIAAANPAHV